MNRIVDFQALDEMEYRALCSKGVNFTPFHSYDWLSCIDKANPKYKLKVLCVYDDGRLVAAIPFCDYIHAPFFMVSGIYNTYGGFVYIEKYRDIINTQFKPFTCINSFNTPELKGSSNYYTSKNTTYLLDIDNTYDNIISSIHSKTRNQIKKSHKSDIKIEILGNNQKHLTQCMDLHKTLMAKHTVSKSFTSEFLLSIFSHSTPYLRTYIAIHNDDVIAYATFLFSDSEIFYFMSSFNSEYAAMNPINGILDRVIHDFCNSSFKHINFGSVPLGNTKLTHFKERWGAKSHEVTTIYNKGFKIINFIRGLLS